MVKEITAYKDEITGKIFKTFSEAKESEAKSKEKLEEKEVTNFVNELAKKYGYKDWSELLWNLRSNSFAIKNAGVNSTLMTRHSHQVQRVCFYLLCQNVTL